jgi:hypothetical protein
MMRFFKCITILYVKIMILDIVHYEIHTSQIVGRMVLFLTIKISDFPKKAKVYGSKSLKMNKRTATIIILAKMKFLIVTFL